LKVRLDDKLSRIINRRDEEDEDVILDLIGYLILLKVSDNLNNSKNLANNIIPEATNEYQT
jgi:hypothetical protein